MPTFLDLFGIDVPQEVQGHSLLPLLKEDRSMRDVAIFGVFGGPIGSTDGRYTYYLYPEDLYGPDLHEYTLMVEDLAQPVKVVGVPTVREEDGLACSSRNVYLTTEERRAAAIVPRALDEAERLIASGVTEPAEIEKRVLEFLAGEPLARPEVVALRDPETLEPFGEISGKPVLILLFVRFGTTKLLDNRVIAPKSARFAKVA